MDRETRISFWGYDGDDDVRKLIAVKDWFSKQEPLTVIALGAAVGLVVLGLADLTRWTFPDQIAKDRQIALLVVTETVLLALVFWVVDAASDRRARRQWEATAGPVIATLRLNMMLTHQRLEHAARHPDDAIAWDAMGQAGRWFLSLIQTNQGILLVHPDLAVFAPEFTSISMLLADAGGALDEQHSVRRVTMDEGVQARLKQIRAAVKDLADRTQTFDERYGAMSQPGTG